MNNQDDEFILVATVGKPIGLKGWAKVNSFTRPPENLFNYKNFFIDEDGTKKVFKIKKFSKSGKNYIFKIDSFNSLVEIERFKNKEIFINSKDLPKLKENEFYWKDLIGMEVISTKGDRFGKVIEMIEAGSRDVMRIKDKNNKKTILIPFEFGVFVEEVKNNQILVNWDRDD